jgi:hypothetical protein
MTSDWTACPPRQCRNLHKHVLPPDPGPKLSAPRHRPGLHPPHRRRPRQDSQPAAHRPLTRYNRPDGRLPAYLGVTPCRRSPPGESPPRRVPVKTVLPGALQNQDRLIAGFIRILLDPTTGSIGEDEDRELGVAPQEGHTASGTVLITRRPCPLAHLNPRRVVHHHRSSQHLISDFAGVLGTFGPCSAAEVPWLLWEPVLDGLARLGVCWVLDDEEAAAWMH